MPELKTFGDPVESGPFTPQSSEHELEESQQEVVIETDLKSKAIKKNELSLFMLQAMIINYTSPYLTVTIIKARS